MGCVVIQFWRATENLKVFQCVPSFHWEVGQLVAVVKGPCSVPMSSRSAMFISSRLNWAGLYLHLDFAFGFR